MGEGKWCWVRVVLIHNAIYRVVAPSRIIVLPCGWFDKKQFCIRDLRSGRLYSRFKKHMAASYSPKVVFDLLPESYSRH